MENTNSVVNRMTFRVDCSKKLPQTLGRHGLPRGPFPELKCSGLIEASPKDVRHFVP